MPNQALPSLLINLDIDPLNSASNPKNAKPNPVTTYGLIILLKNSIFRPSNITNPKKKKKIDTPKNILEVVIFAN